MPTTWAVPGAYRSWSDASAGASWFQVPLKANAMNATTTRWPRSADSVIVRPSWARSVKSGAGSPTFKVFVSVAIFVRPLGRVSATSLR